ncbi:HAD family hydrolase [Stakelama pacifica]|uniref:2-haloacid dehalogenase n=1 Tax=Stakelama pacifica TaxID=517720 RepID=A0A4R6FFS9_9SPHN|nr:HAD family phosphatase [Stakelama pacifica]TDN79264.1 2-haloacid dehalogenase [Stakelama pacifica]GGO98574.1 hydrolase [Stakelama pacifica]
MAGRAKAVIFDIGNVLFHWDPRYLYERLIDDDRALDAFVRDVVTQEWHFQHDAGRDFAETSAELAALYPQHADLIAAWGPRFNESISGPVPGMHEIVAELDSAGVPIFGITNFSHEFWPPFRAEWESVFAPFRDVVVSGEERLVKPDPAIYRLALDRFGLEPQDAVFVDDNPNNVAAAAALGIDAVQFTDAAAFRAKLVEARLLPG